MKHRNVVVFGPGALEESSEDSAIKEAIREVKSVGVEFETTELIPIGRITEKQYDLTKRLNEEPPRKLSLVEEQRISLISHRLLEYRSKKFSIAPHYSRSFLGSMTSGDTRKLPKLSTRISRYQSIRSDVLLPLIEPNFQYVRVTATKMLKKEIVRMLNIVLSIHRVEVELPYEVFSWSHVNFIERRMLPNCIWVDVIQRDIPDHLLAAHKLYCDLQELLVRIKTIFDSFNFIEDPEVVATDLETDFEYLLINETLLSEYKTNSDYFLHEFNKSLVYQVASRDPYHLELKEKVRAALIGYELYNPIEMRYHFNYNAVKEELNRYKCDDILNKLENQIKLYLNKMVTEETLKSSILGIQYALTEKYKNGIREYTEKLSEDGNALDQEIGFKRGLLEKLRARRTFLTAQMALYQEEIEMVKEVERQKLETMKKDLNPVRKSTRRRTKLVKKL